MRTITFRPNKIINRPLITNMVCVALLLFISFNPINSMAGPILPPLKKELKVDGAFQSIRIFGNISVVLTNEPAGAITIEGKERDLNRIKHSMNNNTLVIDANRKNFFSKLTIYLSALTLEAMQVNGDSDITSMDFIRSGNLHLTLNGNILVKIKTLGKLSFDAPDDIELSWKSNNTTGTK